MCFGRPRSDGSMSRCRRADAADVLGSEMPFSSRRSSSSVLAMDRSMDEFCLWIMRPIDDNFFFLDAEGLLWEDEAVSPPPEVVHAMVDALRSLCRKRSMRRPASVESRSLQSSSDGNCRLSDRDVVVVADIVPSAPPAPTANRRRPPSREAWHCDLLRTASASYCWCSRSVALGLNPSWSGATVRSLMKRLPVPDRTDDIRKDGELFSPPLFLLAELPPPPSPPSFPILETTEAWALMAATERGIGVTAGAGDDHICASTFSRAMRPLTEAASLPLRGADPTSCPLPMPTSCRLPCEQALSAGLSTFAERNPQA